MTEKKTSLANKVEDTMACTAYAEAGEPCPIGKGEKPEGTKVKAAAEETVAETMACAAFAEAGEPCPLGKTGKE